MRVTTLVENVEFIARGRYEEQKLPQSDGQFQQSVFRQDLNFPMEMPSSPGAEANRMMVVCHASQDRQNGRVWIYKSIEGTKTIQYIRLAALEDAVVHSKMNAVYPTVGVTPTLGGIGGTLKGIKNLYDFSTSTVEKGHLAEPDSKSVWKITGTLKSGYFNHYLNTLGGLGKKESYPKELPSDIEICIDRETDFPCRIRYLNRKSAKDLPNLVLIEVAYFDIILNGEEIPEYRFMTFKQDGVFSFQDITVPFITSLRLLIP